jgi:hypothetical protein
MGWPPRPVADLGDTDLGGQPLRSRNCRGRTRGSPAGGRTGRAPSPRGAAPRPARCRSHDHAVAHGVVHEAGSPGTPSISTRQSRHEPNAAKGIGGAQPGDVDARNAAAARNTDVPGATWTGMPRPSTVTAERLVGPGPPPGCRGLARARGSSPTSWCRRRIQTEILREVGERAADRHRGESAHRAQRTRVHRRAEVSQAQARRFAGRVALRRGSGRWSRRRAASRSDRVCTCRTTPWRRTPSRTGPSGPGRRCRRRRRPAVAEHEPCLGHGFVVQRDIEELGREIGAERPTDLDRPTGRPAAGAPAEVLDKFAHGDAEVELDEPARATLPASWKTWVPRERSVPWAAYALPPSARIAGTVAEGEHVVDDRGSTEQAREAGIGGLARTSPRDLRGSRASRSPRRRCRHRRRPGPRHRRRALPRMWCRDHPRSPGGAIAGASRRWRADTPSGRRRNPRVAPTA